MTYLGQENHFAKSSYSLSLFEAYFRHLLGCVACMQCLFWSLCAASLLHKKFINLHVV